MKITILAYGSRGDVQPYLALGLGLAHAGHTVRLCTPQIFSSMVETYAQVEGMAEHLRFYALPGDPAQLMRLAASPPPLLAPLPAPVRMGLTVVRYIAPLASQIIHAARDACTDADLVIHSLLTTVIGHQIAHERGVADLSALVFPVFTPTETFPNPLFSPWPGWMRLFGSRAARLDSRYHYLTHREFNRVFWHSNRLAVRLLRRHHPEIPPLEEWPFPWPDNILPQAEPQRPTPILYGISRHTLPCSPESTLCHRLTGFWFLDALPDWHPPASLLRFLDAGSPPVFIGFGSVISSEAKRLARVAIQALGELGQRGILLRGWGGLETNNLPEWIYPLEQAPFDWLFPCMAAAVHHGGVGTSAAALRAGIPSMAIPFTFDQPFWGRQIHVLGAGPAPSRPGDVSIRSLADAIRTMLNDPNMRVKAQKLGEQIRAEDGVANAVKAVENLP